MQTLNYKTTHYGHPIFCPEVHLYCLLLATTCYYTNSQSAGDLNVMTLVASLM